jgi:hypothetical protein
MLIDSGFADIRIDVVCLERPIADLEYFAQASIRGNPVAQQLLERGEDPDRVITAVHADLAAEVGKTLRMPLQAIVYSARKP